MFYFLYNITETAYYNLIIVSKYVCSSPLSNLSPVLTIVWMGGCSRDQKYEGRADFDGITCIWKGHMSLFITTAIPHIPLISRTSIYPAPNGQCIPRNWFIYIPPKIISRTKSVMYPAQLVYIPHNQFIFRV